MNEVKKTFALDIDLVYHALSRMQAAQKLDEFDALCKAKGLALTASGELIGHAKTVLATLPQPKVAGPSCPACSNPTDQ